MNINLNTIIKTTDDTKVREFAAKLMSAGNRRIRATFIKKDGTERTMVCSVRDTWNGMNGITTTRFGKEMTATKAFKGMVCVTEWLADGCFQPRTLNLSTITSLTFV